MGSKRRQEKRSRFFSLGFCPFSQRVPRFSNLRLRAWQTRSDWQIVRWPVAALLALLIGVYFAYALYIRHTVKGRFSSSTYSPHVLKI